MKSPPRQLDRPATDTVADAVRLTWLGSNTHSSSCDNVTNPRTVFTTFSHTRVSKNFPTFEVCFCHLSQRSGIQIAAVSSLATVKASLG